MIGRTGCHLTEEQLVQVLLGTAAVAECLEVERHVRGCARCVRILRGLERASSAYDRAFATLRARRARIAAGRARIAAATEPRVGLGLDFSGRVLRLKLAEAAVALGVMTFAVVGSLTVELSCAIAPLPSRAIRQAPAAAAPQPEDPEGIRAARLKDAEVGDMVFTVTAGSPY